MPLAYLNGNYLDQADAHLPLTDRGLLFGDSIYEVIPVYHGQPFQARAHLARLQQGLQAIHITNPLSQDDWLQVISTLSADNPATAQSIYLQVTRGAYPERAHKLPAQPQSNFFAFSKILHTPDPHIQTHGLHAITQPDVRWHHCDLKTTNLLPNVLALATAHEQGADDAILVRDGVAREGTSSNLIAILDGVLTTSPDNPLLLPGVTRNLILRLAAEAGIPCARRDIHIDVLPQADEIWLTSSTREIAPVTRLDQQPVGDGTPGPVWQQINTLYQAAKTQPDNR
ncbi:MAG: aminotransferase class IV [Pseudomonadota bacterium]